MKLKRNSRPSNAILTLALLLGLVLIFSSCSSPLSRGWNFFSKDQYDQAKLEWGPLNQQDLMDKADAAVKMTELNQKAEDAKAKGDRRSEVQNRIAIMAADKWPKDNWVKNSKALAAIVEASMKTIEEERKVLQAKYDQNIGCGKVAYQADDYENAEKCFIAATAATNAYKGLYLKTEDLSTMMAAVTQAMDIQRQMEAERKAAEEAKRLYEEEQARLLAAQMKEAEEKKQAEEIARIKAEEARQKAEAEKKRRWMEFLAKGRPLKPLVVVIGYSSTGAGTFSKLGEKVKFQGGAQFPILKKQNLKAEDIYALEVVINKDDKATYLRNYSTEKGDLLTMPQAVSGEKHYYTEGYKGGRFYTEVENERAGNDYKIKAVIYKIPVVH
ncbi:MAG: hypothetical protein A2508_07180 [Candidatus Lambdaproteobacteria bacterium RIFOXYD12_FULL_49_8]|uniref:Uncharacterized protein n=1 Tax=Candidatus Lambdaproteobacteria bacterium RIFOXYD2_FULL_50_16 TaxID=1817772 RepID=A0A1F6G9Y3_9PROT|nr:MAG: hypothetical protein A2527_06170 [Candidatus Lambdaproteobacteria bacterium RIFOXYD2_FULL_50_16]OGG97728.1 MAG: hypothetical protein A2508_07180 [Candidatus Lambdaproteobacteria bacterium RIFOXYD12_FULL_49_8]